MLINGGTYLTFPSAGIFTLPSHARKSPVGTISNNNLSWFSLKSETASNFRRRPENVQTRSHCLTVFMWKTEKLVTHLKKLESIIEKWVSRSWQTAVSLRKGRKHQFKLCCFVDLSNFVTRFLFEFLVEQEHAVNRTTLPRLALK